MSLISTLRLPKPVRRILREARGKARAFVNYPALRRSPRMAVRYVLFDREIDNFTYDIANKDELARFLGEVLARDTGSMRQYIHELESDGELKKSIEASLARHGGRNRQMDYGRRLGWYATARATKPALIVETGVHDGLGSAVLLRALQRNANEGSEGSLLSFDIREDVAWLVPTWLKSRYELRIADAMTDLEESVAGRAVDFFIHDSDHRYAHELGEFEAVIRHAGSDAVLLSDNAHSGTAFRDFCESHRLKYFFFREKPANHFYPGAGIGIARAVGHSGVDS